MDHRCLEWIARPARGDVLEMAEGAPAGPFAGATLAIEDNIDLGGVPTTAACPRVRLHARRSPAVEHLIAAAR